MAFEPLVDPGERLPDTANEGGFDVDVRLYHCGWGLARSDGEHSEAYRVWGTNGNCDVYRDPGPSYIASSAA